MLRVRVSMDDEQNFSREPPTCVTSRRVCSGKLLGREESVDMLPFRQHHLEGAKDLTRPITAGINRRTGAGIVTELAAILPQRILARL